MWVPNNWGVSDPEEKEEERTSDGGGAADACPLLAHPFLSTGTITADSMAPSRDSILVIPPYCFSNRSSSKFLTLLTLTINPSGGRRLPLQPQTLTISCLWRMKGKFCRELLISLLKMKTACRVHHQFPIALWSCPSLLSPLRRRRKTGSGKGSVSGPLNCPSRSEWVSATRYHNLVLI